MSAFEDYLQQKMDEESAGAQAAKEAAEKKKAQEQAEEQARQEAAEAEANKSWFEKAGDEVSNTAQWAWNGISGAAETAYDVASETAGEVAAGYQQASEGWNRVMDAERDLTAAYNQSAVEQANATGDFSAQSEAITSAQEDAAAYREGLSNFAGAFTRPTRQAIGEAVDTYAEGGSDAAQDFRASQTYLDYFASDETKLKRAREIEAETGIPVDSFLQDDTAYKEALKVYDYTKKAKNALGDNFSMDAVWQEYPELWDVAHMSASDAALALHRMDEVRETHGIVESFQTMLEYGNLQLEFQNIQYKIMQGEATDADLKRSAELREEMQKQKWQKELPSFFDEPVAWLVGKTAPSLPMFYEPMREAGEDYAAWWWAATIAGAGAGTVIGPEGTLGGAAAGAAVGGATGLARFGWLLIKNLYRYSKTRGLAEAVVNGNATAKAAGVAGAAARGRMAHEIYKPMAGDKFDEYGALTDKNGNTLLSQDARRDYATFAGLGDMILEMAPLGAAKNAFLGRPYARKMIGDAIAGAMERQSVIESGKRFFLDRGKDVLKVAAAEATEEGLQSVSDDVVHNQIAYDTGESSIGVYSMKDIAVRGLKASAEALPASLGFGLLSGAGGTVTGGIGRAAAIRHEAAFEARYGKEAQQTMLGTAMFERIQNALHSSKLKQDAPEVQQKILRSQLKGTGFETVYVDVETALEKENGHKDLQAVAKAAGMTDEELAQAEEQKGTITVAGEQFAQAESSPELLESVSFQPEHESLARMKKNASDTMKAVQERNERFARQQESLQKGILDTYAPDDGTAEAREKRDALAAVLAVNPANPADGWKKVRNEYQAQLDEILKPALDALQAGMGRGGQTMEVQDENGNASYVRFTENSPWYQKFYAEHKRAPRADELEDMAIRMVTGDASAPQVEGWVATDAETQAAMAEAKPQIEAIQKNLHTLDSIKSTARSLNGAEMSLTQGMSGEAFQVYKALTRDLEKAPAKQAQAARMSAILFARHADIFAKKWAERQGKGYTAADYYRERFGIDLTGKYAPGKGYAQPVTELDMELDKKIPVLDLDAMENSLRGKSAKEVLTYIKENLPKESIPTADFKAMIGVPKDSYGKTHLVYNKSARTEENRKATGAVLTNLESVIRHAYLVEVVPNEKVAETKGMTKAKRKVQNRKNKIDEFYRLIVPVRMDGEQKTLVIVAENVHGKTKINEGETSLYEIYAAKKENHSVRLSDNKLSDIRATKNGSPSAISIRDALRGVKDYLKQPYVDENGQANYGLYMKDGVMFFDKEQAEQYKQMAGLIGSNNDGSQASGLMWDAMQMERAGASKEEIWEKTGWTKGEDGAWRYEIPDNLDKIDFGDAKGEKLLGDVYDNEALYRAYPELLNTRVVFEKLGNGVRGDATSDGVLHLDAEQAKKDGKDLKLTLVHEIQHMIQDKEGFSNGGTLSYARELVEHMPEGELKDRLMKQTDETLYRNLAGEQEARNTENRAEEQTKLARLREKAAQDVKDARKAYDDLKQSGEVSNEDRALMERVVEIAERSGHTDADMDTIDQLAEAWDREYKEHGESVRERAFEACNRLSDAIRYKRRENKRRLDVPDVHDKGAIVTFFGQKVAHVVAPEQYAQTAWHGSPHVFDAFDLGAIGTGEGSQAHGWGLYFAKNREVSKGYQDALTKNSRKELISLTVDGTKYFFDGTDYEGNVYVREKDGYPGPDDVSTLFGVFGGSVTNNEEAAKELEILIKDDEERLAHRYEEYDNDRYDADYAYEFQEETERIKDDIARYKEALDMLKHSDVRTEFKENNGSLFQVDVPENDVLLDEQKTFDKQPKAVQEALETLGADTKGIGRDIYLRLSKQLGGDRAASFVLREAGIQGIKYNGRRDGECFVVFNDKATKIIEQFNQRLNGGARVNKGTITPLSDGRRIITILEQADQSTFVHEMGHLFLMDLEDLARVDDVSAKELAIVDDWASWKKGAAKEYQNTPWAREFNTREKNIIAAEEAGDFDTADRLKREWRQERFARAFETYLREGKAPAKGLKQVFKAFKNWLRIVYEKFVGDGGRPSDAVRRVMDRMIATEEEIDDMALDDRFRDVEKAGGEQLLTESEQETYKRWQETAREDAKAQLRKLVMRDLEKKKQEAFDERVAREEQNFRKSLEQEPFYLAQKALELTGDKGAVLSWYDSIEAYEKDAAAMPPLEEALRDYMDAYKKDLDKELIESYLTEEAVTQAMESSEAHAKLEGLVATALAKKAGLINKINAKADRAMMSIEDKLTALPEDVEIKLEKEKAPVKRLMKAINELRFSTRWDAKDYAVIERMVKAATKGEIQAALKEIKERERDDKQTEKAVLEATKGRLATFRKMAQESIQKMELADAINVRKYRQQEKQAARRVNQMIRAKKWGVAVRMQEQRAMSAELARAAEQQRKEVQAKLKRVQKQLTVKTVKLPRDEKYWHQHLAFLLRIAKEDAEKPLPRDIKDERGNVVGKEEPKGLVELFNELESGLDIEKSEGLTDFLASVATAGENFRGWQSLKRAEFDMAIDALTMLYTVGRDKFKMKTIGGKTISEVLDEIMADEGDAAFMSVNRKRVNDSTGGLGYNDWLGRVPGVGTALARQGQGYLSAILKPEEILQALGKTAHKYIYGIYYKAITREAERVEQAVRDLRQLRAAYTHDEVLGWKKKQYEIETADGKEMFSKENVLAMALNMGNKKNMQRLVAGLGMTEDEVRKFVYDHMEEKDWTFVQNTWDYLATYWPETVRVEEQLNGTTLKPVELAPFDVPLENGKVLHMKGGYYHIKYNPEKSIKAMNNEENAFAESMMSGARVLGTRRGQLKQRAQYVARPLLLELHVLPDQLQDTIHNIEVRIPARDVYRLVYSKAMEDKVTETMGADYYKILTEWVTDVWNIVPTETNQATTKLNRIFSYLRRNSVMAIMGYRLWPVIENASNIGPVMDKLGATHALGAIANFYSNFAENKDLLYKSVFMRNRINSMDRDIRQQEGLFEADYRPFEIIRGHAYDLMLYSDLALSAPLWVQSFKDAFSNKLKEVTEERDERVRTLEEARARVDAANAAIVDAQVAAGEARERARAEAAQAAALADMAYTRAGTEQALFQENATEGTEQAGGSPFDVKRQGEVKEEPFGQEMEEPAIEMETEPKPMKELYRDLHEAEDAFAKAQEAEILDDGAVVKEAERRSIAEADAAIRDTFGSGRTMDLASIQRQKSEAMKLMTVFYSFFNTQFNALFSAYRHGKYSGRTEGTIRRWAPFARSVMYRVVVMSLVSCLLKFALGLDGNDDKDKYRKVKNPETGKEEQQEIPPLERFLKVFGKNTLSQVTGSFVLVRDIANTAINLAFDGTTYGRSMNPMESAFRSLEEAGKAVVLLSKKGEKDLELEEKHAKEQQEQEEKLKKLKGKKRQEYLQKLEEDAKYKKPDQRVTYSEALRHGVNAVSTVTAGRTGLTNTLVDAITGTMQYLNDADDRYDKSWRQIFWSALFDKKPVEREIPKRPPAPPKKEKKDKK